MPRKSAAALATITPLRPRPHLAPSSGAPAAVKAVFAEIVTSAPADHFQVGDAPLVEQYAQAIVMARQAAIKLAQHGPMAGAKVSPWLIMLEKAHRSSAALAARLRLSPQHRDTSRSAGRAANKLPPSPYGPGMTYSAADREFDQMIRDMRVGCGIGPCGTHRPGEHSG